MYKILNWAYRIERYSMLRSAVR